MKIRFWGVRGSIPTPPTSKQIREKILKVLEKAACSDITSSITREQFLNNLEDWEVGLIGGNTSCVEVSVDDTIIVCDMGSGLKGLGDDLVQRFTSEGEMTVHILIGHTHWDHIQGFPFFLPAYMPKTKIHFYSPFNNIEDRIRAQQDFQFFPVGFDEMESQKYFHQIEAGGEFTLNDIKISNIELHHPGKSYAYKIAHNNKTAVYATDAEYNNLPIARIFQYIDFYKDADLLIFDAQYSFIEEIQKTDWGHSSALVGVDLAIKAAVKRLGLFHHAPENDDFEIQKLLSIAKDYKNSSYPESELEIFVAAEGLEIEL